MPSPSDRRLQRRALDGAFELAAGQVAGGTAPFVIVGVADARGVIRLEAVSPPSGPALGSDGVCLLASITKPIVATAVMQLVAEGRLNLATPLSVTLPELGATGWSPVSAWHVLSHTSGLGEVAVEPMALLGGGREALVRAVHALRQESAPGTQFRYVTAPFELLADVLERIDGAGLDEVIRRRVTGPLGMTSTTFVPRTDAALAGRVAPIEVGEWDGFPSARGGDLVDGFVALRLAGAGLWSSAPDLLRFGRALLRGGELDGARILPRAWVELMTREVTVGGLGAVPDPLAAEHYALGWGKPGIATPGSRAAFGHGGISGTRLWIDPEHDLVFVYLTGTWGYPSEPIDAVLDAVYAALD